VFIRPNSTIEHVHNALTMSHNVANDNIYNHAELKKLNTKQSAMIGPDVWMLIQIGIGTEHRK